MFSTFYLENPEFWMNRGGGGLNHNGIQKMCQGMLTVQVKAEQSFIHF